MKLTLVLSAGIYGVELFRNIRRDDINCVEDGTNHLDLIALALQVLVEYFLLWRNNAFAPFEFEEEAVVECPVSISYTRNTQK